MKNLLSSFVLGLLVACTPPQESADRVPEASDVTNLTVEGDYSGYITIPGGKELLLVYRVTRDAEDQLQMTMDSPNQGMTGLVADEVVVEDGTLIGRFKQLGGTFSANLTTDEPYTAVWLQGMPFTMQLTRGDLTPERVRPQEPTERLYGVEQVTFPGGADEVVLAGELTLPTTEGPHPAIVLISGSGPQDRDEAFMSHKPFLVISDYFTKRGFAVLRYDDRGAFESTGDHATATTADFADDAAAAYRFLTTDARIDANGIVYMGHSEGGLIAPLAAQSSDPAALVLLAGPAVPLREVLIRQSRDITLAEGLPEIIANQRSELNRSVLETLNGVDTPADIEAAAKEKLLNAGLTDELASAQASALIRPWMMWVIDYDPIPALRGFDAPILALFGTKDTQVSSEQNASPMESALVHPASDVLVFEDHNHLFQRAESGAMTEYTSIETTFEEPVMEAIADWLDQVL